MSTDLQNVVITQLKLRVSRLLSPGPDRLTSTNQAMKYSPGQEVRKCETGRDKQGVMRDNKRLAYSEKLGCLKSLLSPPDGGSFLLLNSVSPAHVWAQYNCRRMGLSSVSSHRDTPITV